MVTGRWVERFQRARELPRRLDALEQEIDGLCGAVAEGRPWRRNLLVPAPDLYQGDPSDPFLADSTPAVRDFLHPRFQEICRILATPHGYHRKLWEWVFVLHTALERGVAVGGRRALGFGVGATEPIAAALASFGMTVTATDAPEEIGETWLAGDQYAASATDLRYQGILKEEGFRQRVHYETCDMNNIPARLSGYDFAWSSSCLDHLGSLQDGLEFVRNSVERTLKVGGVACHTTELNLTSNESTVEAGVTVVYRKRDLDELAVNLRDRGHLVDQITVAPYSHPVDAWVDTPPYLQDPHLKLEFAGFVITSVALVIERGL